ncbi:hypothetical protein [Geothrix sp. 21YS21S-2]|nr:hypothetical protein [Geothrix sp. 21YS21S-2]
MLDGWPAACGRKPFKRFDLPCTPLELTRFGVEKGSTLIDEAVAAKVKA